MTKYRQKLLHEHFIIQTEEQLTSDDWLDISLNRILTEEFIREFKNYVKWKYICRSQQLSLEFLKEFKNKIDWNDYFLYKKAEFPIIKHFFLRSKHKKTDFLYMEHLTEPQKEEIQKLLNLKYHLTK